MPRENRLARVFRSFTSASQALFGKKTGKHSSTIGHFETGQETPTPEDLVALAEKGAEITVADGDELLLIYESLRRPRLRQGRAWEERFADFGRKMAARAQRTFKRLLRLKLPPSPPRAEDVEPAQEQIAILRSYPPDVRASVLEIGPEIQTWAFCIGAGETSVEAASSDLEDSAWWAQLAQDIAKDLQIPEGLQKRVAGQVVGVRGNLLRVKGELDPSDVAIAEAERLWQAGSDPDSLLDPGRLLDLKASLRRAQRRFPEALELLEKALPVSRCPARILIKKGATFVGMGDYRQAVEALLEAKSYLERQPDRRLDNILHYTLTLSQCLLQNYTEAARLLQRVRALAKEMKDEIGLVRCTWLEGKIASGLGRREEARRLLEEAAVKFAAWKMWYDVALALLELSALLLDEGRTAEVKALTPRLVEVFESKKVHREALAALKLFRKAAEREAATAELARRVLDFLFRARYDEGLRFST